MRKIGIVMSLPDGKLPGYYAQIVKGIAEKARLFDREKETLIVDNEDDVRAVLEVLRHYKVEYDELPLLLLPDAAETSAAFGDYGFESRSGNRYMYAGMVTSFRLEAEGADSEPEQAVLQLEEHLIARYPGVNNESIFIVDRELDELMVGVAKAYRCKVHWQRD